MFSNFFACWVIFGPTREFFSLIWRCMIWRVETINGEELQLLTYACHSWPLSSEGSLACHTCCATGLSLIMVISEDPWHSHLLPSVQQWSCHYLFYDIGLSRLGFEHPTSQTLRLRTAPPLLQCFWQKIYTASPKIHILIYRILVFSSPELKANVIISDEPKYPYVKGNCSDGNPELF